MANQIQNSKHRVRRDNEMRSDMEFQEKVRESLADKRPAVPHRQGLNEAQALIDRKRLALSSVAGSAKTVS